MLAQDRGLGDEGAERRSELVRDVGDEPAVLRLGGLEPADRVAERLGHPVERLRPGAELVARGHRDAGREVAAFDPLGRAARPP